tara:strand:+ start:116 stop:979 length:864 start_codon:yes stop_codon:yes gene_type:complete
MNKLNHFFQFIVIIFLFLLFKLLGLKLSSALSGYILLLIGPIFRSNKLSLENLKKAFPNSKHQERSKILNKMWFNYGRILSEYMFIKNFRNSNKYSKKIIIENQEILEKIKTSNEPVIFISGHFNNFELMAMQIEKTGINLAAIYRPLNNIFLNPIMEKIRKRYICKNQIKKGISGTKKLLKEFKKKNSVALMIDQRVSEGIKVNLFNEKAFTTTIPAQFVKKFKTKIVPIYIERIKKSDFRLKVYEPIEFNENENIESITLYLNKLLEEMILKNPEQWIWTHNRWK